MNNNILVLEINIKDIQSYTLKEAEEKLIVVEYFLEREPRTAIKVKYQQYIYLIEDRIEQFQNFENVLHMFNTHVSSCRCGIS
ncbi:hypothetical protein [Adhaeribacter aquaticus]|uniref:hypothetical protein n=1 Tax=Adhaeribacter aquaticus TaxID=299567 RepID=UPI0004261903|nr:hypothetical protein [Adhaeribacter aquaticus]